jgi:hypothetical protein
MKIQSKLNVQDVYDKENIALYGVKQKDESAKITLNNNCLACSGQ